MELLRTFLNQFKVFLIILQHAKNHICEVIYFEFHMDVFLPCSMDGAKNLEARSCFLNNNEYQDYISAFIQNCNCVSNLTLQPSLSQLENTCLRRNDYLKKCTQQMLQSIFLNSRQEQPSLEHQPVSYAFCRILYTVKYFLF